MRHFFSLVLFLCLSLSISHAQHLVCGTHPGSEGFESQLNRLRTNLRAANENSSAARDIKYIPVKFHIGAENDGKNRWSENLVLDQICELNEDYEPYGFQFYIKDGTFNYINNTTFYENHIATQNTVMNFQKDSRALNIFIVKSADHNPDNNGTALAYYNIPRDWIVITRTYVRNNDATLSHEIGHYFSLAHTFNGWEAEAYNTENVNAPTMSPGNIPTERSNGSNCGSSGDLICDTPPDYNNGLGWNGCDFTLNILDPLGETIDPMERNMMSYFLACPDEEYIFSELQSNAMDADYNSFSRNNLRYETPPAYRVITEEAVPVYPIDSETTASYNAVNFEWQGVENADAYVLEISRVSSFSINPIREVVYGTSKVIEGLDADKSYYWRVRPFNASYTCTNVSDITSFRTGGAVATETPSFVEAFTLAPNPVTNNSNLQLRINSTEAFYGNVQLFDITGRAAGNAITHHFNVGAEHINIPVQNLSNGVYLLKVATRAGNITQKVVVANN